MIHYRETTSPKSPASLSPVAVVFARRVDERENSSYIDIYSVDIFLSYSGPSEI